MSGPSVSSPVSEGDEAAIIAALAVARTAVGTDEVPIGAVVVDPSGQIVAAAHNEREAEHDPTAHAEIVVLRRAGAARGSWQLTGCTLAVTIEPCTMCAGAIVLSRVDRLLFGAWDAKAGAAGSVWDVVRDRRLNHRPEVIGGLRADECAELVAAFFAGRR